MIVTTAVIAIFRFAHLGMLLSSLAFLQGDRTGVALLGAIALVGLDALDTGQAAAAVHLSTPLLSFAFMIIAALLRLGRFHGWMAHHVARPPASSPELLAALIAVTAALPTIFGNDVVCLAAAAVLADACATRRLNPVPSLLALACAANVGSAATLIGNPQNMLLGVPVTLPTLVAASAWLAASS